MDSIIDIHNRRIFFQPRFTGMAHCYSMLKEEQECVFKLKKLKEILE